MSNEPDLQLLRLPEVVERTRLSRSQIYALVKQGEFPPPVKLSANFAVWVAAEIQSWIASRIAARPPARDWTQAASSSR